MSSRRLVSWAIAAGGGCRLAGGTCAATVLSIMVCPLAYGRAPFVNRRGQAANSAATNRALTLQNERPSAFTASVEGPVAGQWTIETEPESDTSRLSISGQNDANDAPESTLDVSSSEIQGLGREQLATGGTEARFHIIRDAGVFECKGWLKGGSGSGEFLFSGDHSFVAEMRKLGYDAVSGRQLFSMAMHDVGLAFVYELRALGYDHLTIDQLVDLRVHDVNPDFIIALKWSGLEHPSTDELIKLRTGPEGKAMSICGMHL